MNKKRAYAALLSALLGLTALLFAACSNSSGGVTILPNNNYDEFANKLKALSNVISVEKVTAKNTFHGKLYKVYFNSLLDPKDSSKGTFRQKAYIGFAGYDKPNCLMTTGYNLREETVLNRYCENEAAYILQGNFVAVEHRYFGDSVRTDKKRDYNNYDGTYWEYLTTKNAADDLHAIVTQLKTLFTGKWLAQGASKGGLTANLFCYYHPEDVDVTMPYVAPLCNSKADTRFYDFIYNKAGDEDTRYNTSGDASSYRKLLTNIQIWLLEKRKQTYSEGKTFQEEFYSAIKDTISDQERALPEGFLYDEAIGTFIVPIWQYKDEKTWADLKTFYNLPADDDVSADSEGNRQTKKSFFLNQIISIAAGGQDDSMLAYTFQSFYEIGNYKQDHKYLREAVDQAKASESPATFDIISPEQDATLFYIDFSPAEQALFNNYTPAVCDNLTNWINTTDEQVIMIYGNSDPWYSVRVPDPNPSRNNVHIFVHPSNNHYSMIENFPEPQKSQIEALIKQYMY